MDSLNFINTKLRLRATRQLFWAFSKSPNTESNSAALLSVFQISEQWEQRPISSWEQCILTRYASSKGNKTDGVDTILEVNEAAEMAGNVSDNGSDSSNGGNGNDECGVSVENSLISN